MSTLKIAVAWGSPAGAAAVMSDVLEDITGQRPKHERLIDLAGPNETLQVLASWPEWKLIALAVAGLYGQEIIKEAAKSTWKNIAPKISGFNENVFGRICSAVKEAKSKKGPVIFGLPRTPISGHRHIGIEIESDEPAEIARVIALLSIQGQEIEARLDEWDRSNSTKHFYYKKNTDCSVKLYVSEDGSIEMKIQRPEIMNKIEPVLLAGPFEG